MLLRFYLTQILQSISTVVSSLIRIDRVLLRMFKKGKFDVISFTYRFSQLKSENSVLLVVHSSDW